MITLTFHSLSRLHRQSFAPHHLLAALAPRFDGRVPEGDLKLGRLEEDLGKLFKPPRRDGRVEEGLLEKLCAKERSVTRGSEGEDGEAARTDAFSHSALVPDAPVLLDPAPVRVLVARVDLDTRV